VKELAAPAGYVSSDEILTFEAAYQGQEIPVVKLESVKKNEPTTIEVTKSDITTGVELDGATLTVLDKDGNVVDTWTSVKDEPHTIKRLTVGETYTLREEFAPYGYLKATDVEFTVADTAEIQKVEMKDEVPTALLIINKEGEFLDKVSLVDNLKGTVEHIFEYVTGNLTEVTFEIYAAENIQAADGVSEDYYSKDDLVGTITTDENGIAQMGDLPVGKYYVKEVETAHGYVLDGEVRYVDLSYRDQDTPVVTYDEKWQNARQKVSVNVLKKEKDTDRVLKGGVFGLFAGEDIKSASGKVLIEKDTIIELKTTDENGQITFVADLPVDGSYYVQELYAPDGFVTTNEKQEFVFEYAGADQTTVTYDFTFENEATTVELTKSDLTTGEELPGAQLRVIDENGDLVDEWVSTEEAHVIKELVVGKSYTMIETKPADGYVTAESIDFTIENTAEIQKHEMLDDVTKVEISKTDITGKKELPGAKLTILDSEGNVVESWVSTEEAHYIEKLPIGTYTLREEQAPDGYLVAEDITFEVEDTAEIQKVVMKDEAIPTSVPQTGDDTNLWLPVLLMVLSAAGFTGLFVNRKRKKRKKD
jgi:LPXTG-motif cell wall-anchored protein